MTPNVLTLDDLLDSHTEQIATYGGTHGVRDIGLLESARAQPEAQFGGQYLHADLSRADGNALAQVSLKKRADKRFSRGALVKRMPGIRWDLGNF